MQEGRARKTHLHKGGLHAGQHPCHASLVDIADNAASAFALDKQLLQHTTLEQRSAHFSRGDVDEDFGAHAPACHSGTPAATSIAAVSASGSPTTPEKLPSMRSTNTAPKPWMA